MSPVGVEDPALDPIARRLRDRIGLRVGAISSQRLAAATREMAGASGVDPADLPAVLAHDPRREQELVDRVTVQESQFFRDPAFFTALTERILPTLPDPLVVWSAACARGQEPYSLAMLLTESGRRDWRIHATDISSRALAEARAGEYAELDLRGLDAARRGRHLVPAGRGRSRIADPLRASIDFAAHNLVQDALPAGVGDARLVLLRNVLIYLEDARTRALLEGLARRLAPGTWIALGASEVLAPVDGLELVRLDGAWAYRVPEPTRTPGPRPGPRSRSTGPGPASGGHGPRGSGSTVSDAAGAGRAGGETPDLRARAERHMADGEPAAAVACFRRLVYLDGAHPGHHLNLALSLEAAGDAPAAERAFRASRRLLTDATELDGYRARDVIDLIDDRLATLARRP